MVEASSWRYRRRILVIDVCGGGTIPFPRDRTERDVTGDPRLSIAERYVGKENYLSEVRCGRKISS